MLYIIRGLPGSGKSTFARTLLDRGVVSCHYEADMFFLTKEGVYFYNPNRLKEAHEWCQSSVEHSLKKGFSVAVSNTFTMMWEIEPYVKMCEEIDVPYTIIKMEGKFQNIHEVPAHIIDKMKKRWQDV